MLQAYQILRHGGVPASRIITLMYDDVAGHAGGCCAAGGAGGNRAVPNRSGCASKWGMCVGM